MIQISKPERALLRKAYPELRVKRTKYGRYWLCEESRYLRLLPGNTQAQAALRKNQGVSE